MTTSIQKLAAEFGSEPQSTMQSKWLALAKKSLRGADFESSVVRHSEDGIRLGPLFTEATESKRIAKNATPHLAGRSWHIATFINHPNIKHANQDILEDLKNGASALHLQFDPSGKRGIAARNLSDLQRLFSGVLTNLIPVYMNASTIEQAALFAAYFKDHKDIHNIYLSLGYSQSSLDTETLAGLTQWIAQHAPHWKAVTISGASIHEAGASAAQELAYVLAKATSVVRPMLKTHDFKTAIKLIDVQLASDQDTHFGITKFRAARLLWAKMAEAFGACPDHRHVTINAISSRRMLAKEDPWANILRLNAACFSAVCGGANAITLLPFTYLNGLATPFARRISRNLQLMQMEETRLGQVSDPAYGSYMHETLSHELAAKAWEIFQHIESLGGWENGRDWFKQTVRKTNQDRMQKIQDGEILLVGVNQFTKPDVRKPDVLAWPIIKKRSGQIMSTHHFADLITQAVSGRLVPIEEES